MNEDKKFDDYNDSDELILQDDENNNNEQNDEENKKIADYRKFGGWLIVILVIRIISIVSIITNPYGNVLTILIMIASIVILLIRHPACRILNIVLYGISASFAFLSFITTLINSGLNIFTYILFLATAESVIWAIYFYNSKRVFFYYKLDKKYK